VGRDPQSFHVILFRGPLPPVLVLSLPNTRSEHTDGATAKDWMRNNVSEPRDRARAGSVLPERT